jgi:hypothetical protein
MAFCPLASADSCLEDNVGSAGARIDRDSSAFQLAVARYTSLFHDAFDPYRQSADVIAEPEGGSSGNHWSEVGGSTLAYAGTAWNANDEAIDLSGARFRAWIDRTLANGTLLRETNVLRGLNEAAQGYTWCSRCELFRLHTDPPMWETWAGARPENSVCTWEGPCPGSSVPNYDLRICQQIVL